MEDRLLVGLPMKKDVGTLYEATCQATVARWADHAHIGTIGERPFHPTKLSLTTGNFLGTQTAVSDVLSGIHRLVDGDPLADSLDPASLHFTFLALSQPDYPSLDDLPDLSDVKRVFAQHCHGQRFTLRDLRLVALPNALLIAGLPDASTAARRTAFAQALLVSPWETYLHARYPSSVIPPAFWHSTLVRYQAEYLPKPLRRFFADHQATRYGNISLEINLLATNYSWQVASRLDA